MRSLVVVVVAAACGRAPAPRDTTVPDDLDLEGALERRARDAGVAIPLDAGTSDAGIAEVRIDVVDEGTPPTGGPRIDLAVRDADVADVLRMIAAAAKVGLVVSDDVKARVTLEVRNVTWRQAIDVIAHLEGLAVTEKDGIVTVTRAP